MPTPSSTESADLSGALPALQDAYLDTLVSTQQEIATAVLDLDATMALIAARTQALTRAEGAAVELAEGDEMVYRAATGTTSRFLGLRLKIHGSLSGLCVLSGEILRCDDSETDPRVDREACRRVGARSMVVVPLCHDQETVGVLKVMSSRAHAFDGRDVQTLQLMAGLLGSALARARAATEQSRLIDELQDTLVKLQAATRRAEEATRAKSAFLASMSHELRTPLNAIIGYSELLLEDEADGPNALDLQKIRAAGRHLLHLINDLLDLSKIEAGKFELYLERLEVPPFLEEVLELVRPLAQRNSNRVRLDCAPGLPAMHTDVTRVRQILYNLLSNAAKFTENGEIRLQVEAADEAGVPAIRFAVQDTGIGMTEAQVGRLFQEFVQAESSTAARFGGTGLGLALTRKLCSLLGGKIQVESRQGSGSTFTALLPADSRGPKLPGAASVEPTAEAHPEGDLVLLIAQENATAESIEEYLAGQGLPSRRADSADEGLHLARELRPRAILLDVSTLGPEGWRTLSFLKSDPDLAPIPVVVLSLAGERHAGFALEADDYLPKPFDPGSVRRMVRRLSRPTGASTVLLVDDDPDVRALLRASLGALGCEVLEAANGAEALTVLESSRPSLVLVDLLMPVMDGFELIETIRSRPEWDETPLVVLTGQDLTAQDRRRLEGHVEDIVQKRGKRACELLSEIRTRLEALPRT